MFTKYKEAELLKHKITPKDVDFVLRSEISIWQELPPSRRGNDRVMLVGFDPAGRLLEVGVEYFDNEDTELIFHAIKATPGYRNLFTKIKQ